MSEDSTKELGQVIQIDDDRVRHYLKNVVRGSVEDTLNAMLDTEAERLCNASRYERTEARRDTRAGSCSRKQQTQAGAVTLRVPKLRQQTFLGPFQPRERMRGLIRFATSCLSLCESPSAPMILSNELDLSFSSPR